MLQSTQMLTQPDFAEAAVKRNIWHAKIPAGTKKSDIFDPAFFSNIAAQISVGDRIECVAEDGSFFLELYVICVAERTDTKNPNWANVVEMRYVDLVREEDKGLRLPEGFKAKFRGGAKWCIIRKGATEAEDQNIIERQATKGDAIREFEKMKNKLVA